MLSLCTRCVLQTRLEMQNAPGICSNEDERCQIGEYVNREIRSSMRFVVVPGWAESAGSLDQSTLVNRATTNLAWHLF